MGIQNRDYMKRPPDDDDRPGSWSESKAEELLTGFLQRHPRFFLYVGVGLAVLIVAAVALARLSNRSQ
jgi:hypothetical protein